LFIMITPVSLPDTQVLRQTAQELGKNGQKNVIRAAKEYSGIH
jgi:hypothetical protein